MLSYDPDRYVRPPWEEERPKPSNTKFLTPWGPGQTLYQIAEGVQYITTASHGGLLLSDERVKELPPSYKPFTKDKKWAEEDRDMGIVLAHFGLTDINWDEIESISL